MIRSKLVLLAAALLAAVALAASFRAARASGPLAELTRARPERTFAPRLSIDTEYRRCTALPAKPDSSVPRESCGAVPESPVDLHALALARESAAPDSLHASALAGVIWGEETERSMDDAVDRLEKALRLSRHPVPVLVDLSAVHLVRAQRTQNPRDLAVALNFARDALSEEPRNPAALFNAALAMDAMGLEEQAVGAWDRYLAAEPDSAWAAEGRARKRALARAPALPDPRPGASVAEVEAFAAADAQRARLLGWDSVLGVWGRAQLRGSAAGAASALELAERLGAALEKRGGDPSLADAVRIIRAAKDDPSATASLARGHRDYAAAQAYYHDLKQDSAAAALVRVLRARPPSPGLVHSAEAFQTATMVYAGALDPAIAAFEALLSRMDRSRLPALEARVRWMMGTGLIRAGRYPEAREQYQASTALFQRLGEREYAGVTRAFLGETRYEQGDTASAYRELHQALHMLRPYRSSLWLHGQLLILARAARLDGMPLAALAIHEEGVSVVERFGHPLVTLEALLALTNARAAAGDTAQARRDMDTIAVLVTEVAATTQGWVAETLRYWRMTLQPVSLDSSSSAGMDSAITYFEEKNVWWALRVLMRRADARLQAGDVAGATADLERFTAKVRELSKKDDTTALRGAMLEDARSRIDQLVMLHLHAGRDEDALRALERGRVSFGSAQEAASARRGPLAAPAGQVALEYALIGDTLVVWTIRGTSVHVHHDTVDRREFRLVTEQVSASLESPRGESAALPGLRRLHDWLIGPVRHRLGPPETPLVIMADGEVARVPFAALLDGSRGRFLVQDHPLRFAATLEDAARPRPALPPSLRALLVANPAFDRTAHPTLDPLAGAVDEVRALQELYGNHVVLQDSGATRHALATRAQAAGVIHYAGHAVFDDARPERSFLVLADRDTAGQLTAEAIHSLRLGGVRLVVLSACRTLRSRDGRSGGFTGISGALLMAGAGGVVGSLWEVDDRHTQPLMVAFHREYLRSRGDPAVALRRAQLAMLAEADAALRSPATWAGFRYAGR